MSHELTSTDNMFSVREMPWHRLGEVLENYPTRAEAQPLVHGWEPVATPLYRGVPEIAEDGELRTRYEEVSNHVAQERSDNGALLGVTTKTFTPVLNDTMWDVAEAIQGGGVDVRYETGGSIRGGAHVWLMLRLEEPLVIDRDPNGASIPFYLLQNAHDGSGAFRGLATQVRVVCANTIRAADMDAKAKGTEFTFRHTQSVADRIEEAREALAGWRVSVEEYRQLANLMLGEKVSAKGEREFLERFIPAPLDPMTSDRVKRNIEEARDQWREVYASVTCEGITGTAWGLLQASSEWSEHIRRANSNESRFRRAVLDRNDIIASATTFAREAALV
jgi:phage/plasmid-like protein (TIGR03299 family)